MSRRMAFLHLPPIRWLTSFYNPPFNNYLEDTDEFDDDLVGSIEIWEQELNELSDPKRISVDLNELMNK